MKPFYGRVHHRRGLFVQAEMIETTKPGDLWMTHAPTGRRRAYWWGLRIPLWAVDWFMKARA